MSIRERETKRPFETTPPVLGETTFAGEDLRGTLREMLLNMDMRIGIAPVAIDSTGCVEWGGGSLLPMVRVEASRGLVEALQDGVSRLSELESRVKRGFYNLFTHNPGEGVCLLRYAFNVQEGESAFVEELGKAFSINPFLCLDTTHSYRADGRISQEGILSFNEINANPGGTHWAPRVAEVMGSLSGYNYLEVELLEQSILKFIAQRTNFGLVFFPTEDLSRYKVLSEIMAWGKELQHRLGIDWVIGEPSILKVDNNLNVFINHRGQRIPVAYIDGVSSPTTFNGNRKLIEATTAGRVVCPSLGATTISLSNKGFFALITAMREGKYDPHGLGLSPDELHALSRNIPDTYWVSEDGKNPTREALAMVERNQAVLKPFDGCGGDSVILNPTPEDIQSRVGGGWVVQERLREFRVEIGDIVHAGSIDPYFSLPDGKLLGAISRGSVPGTLSNVSAHVDANNQSHSLPNHLGIVFVKK